MIGPLLKLDLCNSWQSKVDPQSCLDTEDLSHILYPKQILTQTTKCRDKGGNYVCCCLPIGRGAVLILPGHLAADLCVEHR